MDLIEYRKINDSFERTLVFHLGVDAGFFSEFNNMVLAMLYCLQNEIRFVLYSDDANLMISRGWSDFFAPFCEEARQVEHHRFNRRYPPNELPTEERAKAFLFKKANGIDFLTYELWNDFRSRAFEKQSFSFAGYEHLDLRSAARVLISMIWSYNAETKSRVAGIRSTVSLPARYLGVHVRGGDRYAEAPLIDLCRYVATARSLSPLRDIFLATDDYSSFENARRRHPDYSFSTLCAPSERGYIHGTPVKRDPEARKTGLLRLFASMDILASAEYFIGTFSSNIGMHLGMRMSKERVFGVDTRKWTIW